MIYLNAFANIFTIGGVCSAIIIYLLWKHDYRLKKSHEYALTLLKKIKYLHMEVESLRAPKFFQKKTIAEDIEKHFIPQIEERILKKVIDITVDLLIAEQSLERHKGLQSKFNDIIINKIIYPLNSAVYGFFLQKKDGFSAESTDLFKIIFPAEVRESKWEIKKSVLGTGNEVIDNDFNKVIESSFNTIYDDLEDNLTVDVSKKGKILKIRTTLSIFKRIVCGD